jgi:hypothetical protein
MNDNVTKFLLGSHLLRWSRVVQVQVNNKIWRKRLYLFSYILSDLAPFPVHKLPIIITVVNSIQKNASAFHFTD